MSRHKARFCDEFLECETAVPSRRGVDYTDSLRDEVAHLAGSHRARDQRAMAQLGWPSTQNSATTLAPATRAANALRSKWVSTSRSNARTYAGYSCSRVCAVW
jgi:hypothetical protein